MHKESSSQHKQIVKDVEAQFLTCYDAYADAIFRQCYFKTSDREIAKDLTQEVFARTWDYLVQGKTVENLKSFIFTVANNAVKDWYKKHRAIPESAFEHDPFASFSDESQNSEVIAEVSVVMRALETLESGDRAVITMRFVEGMPPREIAGILGERENTVSVRITRALKKLRLLIDPTET